MLTARLGCEIIRAGSNLKGKDFVYRCLDEQCENPVMELVLGRGLRIPHFRHKRRGQCTCSDGETEWHREWKSHFERIECDMGIDPVTGEHNRADAVVGNDFVIEFQHSHISDEEQKSRERFYGGKGGMAWIVDANKKRPLKRLDDAIQNHDFTSIKEQPFNGMYFKVYFPDEVFPKEWLARPVGVIFDYGQDRDLIYLLPMRGSPAAVCRFYKRCDLIDALKNKSEQFMCSATEMESNYRRQEKVKREAEEKARRELEEDTRRKEEEEKQKAELELRRKIDEAICQAQKMRQMQPPNKLYFHPVEGTSLYVDASGRRYNRVGNQLVPVVARPAWTPQFPIRRRWRF